MYSFLACIKVPTISSKSHYLITKDDLFLDLAKRKGTRQMLYIVKCKRLSTLSSRAKPERGRAGGKGFSRSIKMNHEDPL